MQTQTTLSLKPGATARLGALHNHVTKPATLPAFKLLQPVRSGATKAAHHAPLSAQQWQRAIPTSELCRELAEAVRDLAPAQSFDAGLSPGQYRELGGVGYAAILTEHSDDPAARFFTFLNRAHRDPQHGVIVGAFDKRGLLVDLVAFDSRKPHVFFRRTGQAAILGVANVARARVTEEPLNVWSNPGVWLSRDARGIVILDKASAVPELTRVRELRCGSRRMAEWLAREFERQGLAVPKITAPQEVIRQGARHGDGSPAEVLRDKIARAFAPRLTENRIYRMGRSGREG